MSCSKCESKRCITFKESIYNLVVRVGVLWNIRVLCLWTVDWFFSYWYFNLDTCLIIYLRNDFCFSFILNAKFRRSIRQLFFLYWNCFQCYIIGILHWRKLWLQHCQYTLFLCVNIWIYFSTKSRCYCMHFQFILL